MTLTPYRRKRDFTNTPEPSGRKIHTNGHLHFVVQKHDASHLHFDFRLENHGVLKSWAVPKGISTDPKTRRLAIEVEDHPFDYRNFEGTIPEGNYGGGTVMVWDQGEYFIDPDLSKEENERKIEEALAKGHLTFYLDGKKLHGAYTLVRLHGHGREDGKKPQWFLIKKDDDFARKPIEDEDVSAATGRTLDEIARKTPKERIKTRIPSAKKPPQPTAPAIDLHAAPKASMPEKVEPMLATLAGQPFDGKDWIFEVKWDGYRIIAQVEKGSVRLYSRNNKTYTENFPEVAAAFKKVPDMILDGEIVVVDERGISQFQLLQNYMRDKRGGQLVYYVFDIVYLDGHALHHLPLIRRKEILSQILPGSGYVRFSQHLAEKGKAFYQAAKEHGLEGVVAKHAESTYQFGRRGRDWVKIKAICEQEAVICGFTAPKGGRKLFGALILGLYKDDQLRYIGHTGGGFDHQSLKDMYGRLKPLVTDKCPFKTKPKTNAPVTWVKPRLLCEVKFQEWTDDGHMRQPIFLGIREDKKPKEVRQEISAPTEKVIPKTARETSKKQDAIGPVKITHPEKVYWPKEKYTKGDMIQYYRQIAPLILPYLKGRPHVLRRHPDGIEGEGFFQKDIETKPDWVKTLALRSESRNEIVKYLICENEDHLLYMCNLGCIEISPWASTVDKIEYPDYLVLDFDPVDVDFPTVIDVVAASKKILDQAKLPGFCKTSGGRGLHVYVPLGKKYTYEQTKDFAHLLCMAINRQSPDVTSLERSPHKRKGLIYLDYLQNHYGATMAAPYALRPRPGAPVSTPLEWKEVKRGLDPLDFNMQSIPSRIKKKGDLWKGVLGTGIDMTKALTALKFR